MTTISFRVISTSFINVLGTIIIRNVYCKIGFYTISLSKKGDMKDGLQKVGRSSDTNGDSESVTGNQQRVD